VRPAILRDLFDFRSLGGSGTDVRLPKKDDPRLFEEIGVFAVTCCEHCTEVLPLASLVRKFN
jgi:hypothetical protein